MSLHTILCNERYEAGDAAKVLVPARREVDNVDLLGEGTVHTNLEVRTAYGCLKEEEGKDGTSGSLLKNQHVLLISTETTPFRHTA